MIHLLHQGKMFHFFLRLKEKSNYMAEIVFEDREFKDRETGIVTNYQYIAIKGGKGSKIYEVQLKNLVQSEKQALLMISDMESVGGSVETRKSTDEEQEKFIKSIVKDPDDSDFLND